MIPDHLIFDALAKSIESTGVPVYSLEMPPEDAPCPHVAMVYNTSTESPLKTGTTGEVLVRVNVWHDRLDQREKLSEIIRNIQTKARNLTVEGFSILLYRSNQNMILDTWNPTPYLHGVLDFYYKY